MIKDASSEHWNNTPERLAARRVPRLEPQVLEHPAQWFNFYDFWHEEQRP